VDSGGEALAGAICKNVLNGTGMDQAHKLAAYARATEAALAAAAEPELLRGAFAFPQAIREDITS
uniref:ubiquinol-cytochrome C chaperone family protein n=1 Tax=Pseudomonas sp. EA_65y_Pfl1_P113 TaxID=3088692 RepID=UPI0030D9B68F